jgi:exosortase
MMEATIVILGGGTDFGRCPVATRLPRALWPIVARSVLDYQLEWLASEGVRKVTICAAGRKRLDEYGVEIHAPRGMDVRFVSDVMPRGTAGSIRDAVGTDAGTVLVIKAGVVRARRLDGLVAAHKESGGVLTVFTNEAPADGGTLLSTAGVYACEAQAIRAIPREGYSDIKEQLVPMLLRRGERVCAAALGEAVSAGRDINGYLELVGKFISQPESMGLDLAGYQKRDGGIWTGRGAEIDAGARLCGPCVIMPEARIEMGAIVVGPAVVGRGALVSKDAVVDRSVIWEGAFVGRGALVRGCILDEGGIVGPGHLCRGGVVAAARRQAAKANNGGTERAGALAAQARREWRKEVHHTLADGPRPGYIAGAAAACAALLWSFWDVAGDLWRSWMNDPNYSSGMLVPALAAYVLYTQRADLARARVHPALWGAALACLGIVVRFAGTMLMSISIERLGLYMALVAVAVTGFGTRMTWRLKWVLLFMGLMFPWPYRVHNAVSLPLQNWATSSSVFALELLGWGVIREGNVLRMGETSVAVAEACSGLRMLTAFVTVSGLMALVVKRSWWERALIVASSIPIAVLCNTLRLTATAIAYDANYGPQVNQWFHDFGGIAMMPLALAIMWGEMWLMSKLAPPTTG